MPRTPPAGPHFTVEVNGKKYGGTLTQAVWDAILDGQRESEVNIGSVASGVAEAKANAAAAQATADAAAQQASDVGNAALSFSGSVSPAIASGTRFGPGSVTTNTVTVTPDGGTGPYTYAWTYVSGDTFTVNSPTSAATSFSTSLTAGQEKSGVYRCTITDSLLATATVTVGVSASELS